MNKQMNDDTVSDKTCHQFKDSKLRMSVHYYNMYTYKHSTHYTMTCYSKVTTQFTVYYIEFQLDYSNCSPFEEINQNIFFNTSFETKKY